MGGVKDGRAKVERSSTVFATVVPFLAFQLPMIPALYVLESGIYSKEIGEAGREVGSPTIFLIYVAVALLAFFAALALAPHRAPPMPGRRYMKTANVLSVALLLFYCIPLVVYKPAYLTGMNRYDFVQLPFAGFFNVKIYLAIICCYHGWMFARTRKLWHLAYFALVVLAQIGWGEKFSGPSYAITYFVTGLALSGGFAKKLAIAGVIFLPIILGIWSLPLLLVDRTDEAVDAFENRLGRQAQVFYKVIDEPPEGEKAMPLPELLNYFSPNIPEYNGLNYLKALYIPPDLAEIHEGSYAAGWPAVILSTGLFSGFFVVFLLEVLRFLLMREVLIVGFHAQKLWLVPVYIYFLMYLGKIYESGNTYILTSPYFLGLAAIIVVGNRLRLISKSQYEALPRTGLSAV
jgi:hypothetical protein